MHQSTATDTVRAAPHANKHTEPTGANERPGGRRTMKVVAPGVKPGLPGLGGSYVAKRCIGERGHRRAWRVARARKTHTPHTRTTLALHMKQNEARVPGSRALLLFSPNLTRGHRVVCK